MNPSSTFGLLFTTQNYVSKYFILLIFLTDFYFADFNLQLTVGRPFCRYHFPAKTFQKHFRKFIKIFTLQYRLPGFGCSFQTFELRKEAKNIRSFLLWSNRDISWNRWNKENKNIVSSKVSFEINELVISEKKRKRQVNRLLIRKRRLINVNKLISGKVTFSLRQINSFFLKWACVEPKI